MIGPHARHSLEGLLAEVDVLRAAVAPRCAGFHRSAVALERDLRRRLQRWWPPWLRDEELARYEALLTELRVASPQFAAVATRLLALDERLGRLREHRPTPADLEVESWLGRQCDGWVGVLSRLGQAQRRAELQAEEARLADLETEVRTGEEAVSVLAALSRAVAALPNQVAAAPLVAHLAGLREQVLAGSATAPWLAEVRRFLAPLVELQSAAAAPAADENAPSAPAEEVVALVTLLQSWSLATGLLAAEVEELARRVLHGGDGADDATAEVRALLRRLLADARVGREQASQQVERQLDDFRRVCGMQPDQIEGELRELVSVVVDDPVAHQAWRRRLQALRHQFEGLAGALEHEIVGAFAALLTKVEAGLERIDGGELPADLAAVRDRLAGERLRLRELRSWKEALPHLREAEALLAKVADLLASIETERVAGERAQARRIALLEELRELSPARLRPREQVEVQECVQQLTSWDGGAAADLRARRLSLQPIVEWGEGLLARLHQAEERAKSLHAALGTRLAELQRADYGLGCRELVDRVEALVHGVPARPRAYGELEDQLAEADVLLERLDRHGRRVAATRLDESVTLLRQALLGRLDPKLRQEVHELLGQLANAGDETLPPASWRHRAAGLCRRVRMPRRVGAWR
jgi:hypothetical protein